MDDIEEWLCADVVRLLYLDLNLSLFSLPLSLSSILSFVFL